MNIIITLFSIIILQMCSQDFIPGKEIKSYCHPDEWKIEKGKENHLYNLIDNDDHDSAKSYLKDCGNPHGCTYIKGKNCYFPLSVVKNEMITKLLTDYGADIHKKDANGRSPIHHASLLNNKDSIKILIQRGANIEDEDINKMSAIHLSSINRNIEITELLIKEGINVNKQDINGQTPLYHSIIAKEEGEEDLDLDIEFLIYELPNIDEFLKSDKHESNERLRLFLVLLNSGAWPETPDRRGYRPLHYAALRGYANIANILVNQAKVDSQQSYNKGFFPMHLAAAAGHTNVMDVLLASDRHACIDCKDIEGNTPLHWAARLLNKNSIEVINKLKKARYNTNARNKNKVTPYGIAKKFNHIQLASLIQSYGGRE